MKRYLIVALLLMGAIAYAGQERRLAGQEDICWGPDNTYTDSSGKAFTCVSANVIPFTDNSDVKVNRLYGYATAYDNGTSGYCLKYSEGGVFYWGECSNATNPVFTGDVTITGELTVQQINSTCDPALNQCYINASNNGDPACDNTRTGNIHYNSAEMILKICNGTSFDNVAVNQ